MSERPAQPRNFGFDEDAMALRDAAQRFLEDQLPAHALHRIVAADSDPRHGSACRWDLELWRRIVDLGWLGVLVPESAGGLGMPLVAAAALVEQCGRSALPGPLLPTLSATCLLRSCGTEAAHRALEQIAAGHSFSYASCNAQGSWAPEHSDVTLADGRLNGIAWYVQDLQKVDYVLVNAHESGHTVLVSLPVSGDGLQIQADQIVDLTRDQGRVVLQDCPVTAEQVVAGPDAALAAIREATPAMLTLHSADMCGVAEWQLQTTAEYARTRRQFDRTIGFFQAVKHPLVEFMVALDLARSHLFNAACAVDHEPELAEIYARMARSAAGDAAAFGSRKSVQLHGGIGFTWECFVHIYLKRQMHNRMLLGDSAYQRARLAELIDAAPDATRAHAAREAPRG